MLQPLWEKLVIQFSQPTAEYQWTKMMTYCRTVVTQKHRNNTYWSQENLHQTLFCSVIFSLSFCTHNYYCCVCNATSKLIIIISNDNTAYMSRKVMYNNSVFVWHLWKMFLNHSHICTDDILYVISSIINVDSTAYLYFV